MIEDGVDGVLGAKSSRRKRRISSSSHHDAWPHGTPKDGCGDEPWGICPATGPEPGRSRRGGPGPGPWGRGEISEVAGSLIPLYRRALPRAPAP